MKTILLAIALASTVPATALANPSAKTEAASKDIVDTALSDPRFSTLVEAVKVSSKR